MTDGCDISSEIALRWTSLDLSDDKSTVVQVMAWCRQATSHYLNQCWPRSLPPYGVTRLQWVASLVPGRSGGDFKNTIFNPVLTISIYKSYDDTLRWIPRDLTDVKSTSVQVMARCHQATSHYLNLCWSSLMISYGVIVPKWVNLWNVESFQ